MNFKGSQSEREIIMWAVRWYIAYPISYRQTRGNDGRVRSRRGSFHAQPVGNQIRPEV